jgi:hypothetical protein
MSRGDGTESADGLDGRVPASDAVAVELGMAVERVEIAKRGQERLDSVS